jgi:phage tail tape-measure protein
MLWRRPRTREEQEELDRHSSGLTVGQRFDIGETAFDVFTRGAGGNPLNWMTATLAGLDIGISTGTARKKNAAGAAASAAAAQAAGIVGFITGRAAGVAIGSFILPGVGTWAGGIIGGGVGSLVGDKKARVATQRLVNSIAIYRPRVRFGGNFKDSQPAYTMRAKAEQELSGSLLNARRYLGREAQLMHQ